MMIEFNKNKSLEIMFKLFVTQENINHLKYLLNKQIKPIYKTSFRLNLKTWNIKEKRGLKVI